MSERIIQQGAEAVIILKNSNIIKKRIKKSYRIQEIDDKIRKLRTRSEAKMLERASKVIPIPHIIKVDEKNQEIIMENIDGQKLSDNLDKYKEKEQNEICIQIGENIAKIHDENIIHGDLTTSNMIYVGGDNNTNNVMGKDKTSRNPIIKKEVYQGIKNSLSLTTNNKSANENEQQSSNFKIYFIDFGLGFYSEKIEDKAVDLHLLKEALEAKHFKHAEELFKSVCKGYSTSKNNTKVLEQLKKVESRGRYKERY